MAGAFSSAFSSAFDVGAAAAARFFYFRYVSARPKLSKLLVLANEATAAQRRVYFHLVDATDGITAETGEAGGQPQVSSDGGAWTNTGIGTLNAIGNGRYYADLTQTLVQTTGTLIETRYKSANTAECPGDSVQVVAFDPNDSAALGLTLMPANVTQISGDSAAADNLESYTDGTTPMPVNATQLSGDATAADNAEAFFDGTGYAGTNNVIPTVTTVTNLHASAATAAELAKVPKSDSNVTWNATALASINAQADTALADYDGPTYSELLNFVRVMCRKDAALAVDLLSVVTAINVDMGSGGGAYALTTDSLEALRDNTGTAGAGLTSIDLPDQTMNITGNITGNLSGSVGSVTGAVGSVTGNVGGNVTGSVGSLATQAKTDVNAEVVDALATDTYAEPGQGTPSATLSLAAKINYMFKSWRNKKTQTSTTWSLYADDATTVDQKATVSDDATTATKGEIATGP